MKKHLGQSQFFKEGNCNIINRIIMERGPISKPQIAQITGLSLPTVNKIVYYLEDQKRIKEAGTTSGLGRKALLYVTNEDFGNILTLSLSGVTLTCCVVNISGEILHRFAVEINPESYDTATQGLFAAIDRLIGNSNARIASIGIGLPGWVGKNGVVMRTPPVPAWSGVNLKELVEKRYHVAAYVESNARFSAIGYFDWVLKREYQDMIYLHIGKEMASGIILNKQLFTGSGYFAGGCGYMVTDDLEKVPKEIDEEGGFLERRFVRLAEGMNLVQEKEALLSLKQDLALSLASVMINYITVINPEVIVLGGNTISKEFAQRVSEMVARYIPKEAMPTVEVDSNSMTGIQGITSWCKAKMNMGYDYDKRC